MTNADTLRGRPLQERLAQAGAEATRPIDRAEIEAVVRAVLSSLSGDLSSQDVRLYGELERLARYILDTRREIAAIQPRDISEEHIPRANDELDAVVGATEDATNQIMDACDAITNVAGQIDPALGQALTGQVTRIFEACNFQDITGQRITRVVRTLVKIEERIGLLLEVFGDGTGLAVPTIPQAQESAGDNSDDHLMNGPQLPGNAISQDEIDRLLASFD